MIPLGRWPRRLFVVLLAALWTPFLAWATDDEFRQAILAPNQKLPPVRALTHGPKFHWFGHYDKLEFDPTQRYVLSNEVAFEGRSPREDDVIKIGMIDLKDGDKWIELGQSRAWCWRQGCMLQWRPGSKNEVLWNDRQGDRFVCHIFDVETGKKRTLPRPIHNVSPDGKRFLFLCRDSLPGWDKTTRMFTAADDGSDLRLVNLGSSHYTWRDNGHILIWVGGSFRLFADDGSLRGQTLWEASSNGHQSYLPGNEWLVCDTYPLGSERLQHLYLFHVPARRFVPLGHFRCPSGYDDEWRCDTHPRLSPDGTKVVIDSPHGGNGRQLYLIDIGDPLNKP